MQGTYKLSPILIQMTLDSWSWVNAKPTHEWVTEMDIGNVMAECQEIGCKFLRVAYLHVYLQKNMEIDWSQTKKTQAGIWWREAVNEEDEIITRIKTIEEDLERSRLMWRKQKTILRTKTKLRLYGLFTI